MTAFNRSVAVVIGINDYEHFPALSSAVSDAKAIGQVLEAQHGYEIRPLLNEQATRVGWKALFERELLNLDEADRLLVYFAGHGIAEDTGDRPEGYLVFREGQQAHDQRQTLLPMRDLNDDLARVRCSHVLLVLDCCFAGSFRWAASSVRGGQEPCIAGRRLHRYEYKRCVGSKAAQVLTSSAADEKAFDEVGGMLIGRRGMVGGHSPFAAALMDGLRGAADMCGPDGQRDGIITATELQMHIGRAIGPITRQTPQLWALPQHDKGEFVFWPDGAEMVAHLVDDPVLDAAANPWRGADAYEDDPQREGLLFGREDEIEALTGLLDAEPAEGLIAVIGASGAGKTSLINGGLAPRLKAAGGWQVLGPIRPGATPMKSLAECLGALHEEAPRALLVLDALDGVFTRGCPRAEREAFFQALQTSPTTHPTLRIIATVRSDHEARVAALAEQAGLPLRRFIIPAMDAEALRRVVCGPATLRVLYFEPLALIDDLVREVARSPGGLPLLSMRLAEMYLGYLGSHETGRTLRREHLDAVGDIAGWIERRASALYAQADDAQKETIQELMLRMVQSEGGKRSSRRVMDGELRAYVRSKAKVTLAVVNLFVDARLLVRGSVEIDGKAEGYVEPAHDALVRRWSQVTQWLDGARPRLGLQRDLKAAANSWHTSGRTRALLWSRDPRLAQTRALAQKVNALEYEFIRHSRRGRMLRRWL
ncbi:MAG: caspase family protein, partial [Myxococcales bacterium]|nr:caspase family protein [Myxococcales bacterium]